MTTKTYDKVPPPPQGWEDAGEIPPPPAGWEDVTDVKKKDSRLSGKLSAEASADFGDGTKSTLPSPSPSPLDANAIFEFNKYRRKDRKPLAANLPRQQKQLEEIATKVYMGNIEGEDLSDAYSSSFTKDAVDKVISDFAPDMGSAGWSEGAHKIEKWNELAKRIKEKNRINSKVARDSYTIS